MSLSKKCDKPILNAWNKYSMCNKSRKDFDRKDDN
jgi:hypothetical protein